MTEQELYHWKYLRKEKVNGKWRYYYEEDDAKLNVGRTHKAVAETSIGLGGKVKTSKNYLLKSKETGNNWEVVDKKVYDSHKAGRKLYVGNTPLSKIAKEQISIGRSFVSDLLTGNLYRKK